MTKVIICIPTIPPRSGTGQLQRALESVRAQDVGDDVTVEWSVAHDHLHQGAWATRNQAVTAALALSPDWIGFLDDDDELLPFHVDYLLGLAAKHDAAMVWGWFQIVYPGRGVQPVGVGDPFANLNDGRGYRGKQYDPAKPHIVPITYMVRADVLRSAMASCGGFQPDGVGAWDNQDQLIIDTIYEISDGALHADKRTTWLWHHHGFGQPGRPGNTSGLPTRW